MSEYYDSQRKQRSIFRKLLQLRIDKVNQPRKLTSDDEKTYFSSPLLIYNVKLILKQRWCKLKSFDELKAKMETIQRQMLEAMKNELVHTIKEVKCLFKRDWLCCWNDQRHTS